MPVLSNWKTPVVSAEARSLKVSLSSKSKFAKSGGIHNAIKINAIAEGAGIRTQVGCMSESRYALTALCHFVAARNNIVWFDIDASLSHAEDPVTGGIQYMGKGKWELPQVPGIGADFDPDFLKKMEKTII